MTLKIRCKSIKSITEKRGMVYNIVIICNAGSFLTSVHRKSALSIYKVRKAMFFQETKKLRNKPIGRI
jgi:hypothetical protein